MSGYFGMLPPELMAKILDELKPPAMVALMKCSKNLHVYVEAEIFLHKFARDVVMDWGIRNGQLNVIRRLVEKYGASPSFYGGAILNATVQGQPVALPTDRFACVYPKSTLLAVLKYAPDIEEALLTFAKLGAVLEPALCTRSTKDVAESGFPRDKLSSIWYRQMYSFARRMVAMPTKTEKQRKDKLAALQYYYDTGCESFVTHRGALPNIVCSLPRLIRSDDDLSTVRFILDQEGIVEVKGNKIEERRKRHKAEGDDEAMLDEGNSQGEEAIVYREPSCSYPIVDRPERCGPNGAPISPLSAAVLCDAKKVFNLLIERGADINGPKLDFTKHGPTTHALHIPIFAAANVLARRKSHESGEYWINRSVALGADINQMALCKLSGKHRPYRPVASSLGYYAQGMSYPPNGCVYFWATPMDVYMDCISLGYLRKRIVEQDDGFGGPGTVDTIEGNMSVFIMHNAHADIARMRSPPRKQDQDTSDGAGTNDSSTQKENGAQNNQNLSDAAYEIYKGDPTDPSLDKWRNWKRIVSPVTIEILLDRVTVSGMAHPVAASYAEVLRECFKSGSGQAARLMSKYDGPAPESRYPSWTSGAEAVGRRTLAMLLLCDDQSESQSIELHRYIVYAVRRADMLFMDKVVDNIEQVFSGPTSHIDVEGPYIPNEMDDDVEYQCYLADGDDPRINRAQSEDRMDHWTALHEICRLCNLQMIDYDKGRDNPHNTPPRFARQIPTTMKLLATLLTHGFSMHQEAENGMTPYDVLLQNPDSVLRTESMVLLDTIADYMKITAGMLGLAIKG